MSSLPSIFTFPDTSDEIRVIMRVSPVGEPRAPWFVAKDVCAVLGFTDSGQFLRLLDEDEKETYPAQYAGQVRNLAIISESGLYSLILRSRQPAAVRFKKWITSEVLPRIRKTGGYIMGEEAVAAGTMSIEEMTAKVLVHFQGKIAALTEERDNLEKSRAALQTSVEALGEVVNKRDEENQGLAKMVGEMEPKAEFHDDVVAGADQGATTATLANSLGITLKQFCWWARNNGYVEKAGGRHKA